MVKYLLIISGIISPSYIYSQRNMTIAPHTVTYDLNVKDTFVNYTGRSRHAIAINGNIPGPTIELTQGDTAVINVHNLMVVTTSIHWHDILILISLMVCQGLRLFLFSQAKHSPLFSRSPKWYLLVSFPYDDIGAN